MNNRKRQGEEPTAAEQEHAFAELRHYVPAEILNVSFPVGFRNSVSPLWLRWFETCAFNSSSEGQDRNGLASS
jgi:hypothetical protein